MRFTTIIAFLTISCAVAANAQTTLKPPVIPPSPITPTDSNPAAPFVPPTTVTTLPVNPVDVNVQITELIVTTGGKPYVLPLLPAPGVPRDDEKAAKQTALRNKFRIVENTVGEADAPDGGTGSSSSTDMTPAGFVTFPDGHQGYNPVASEQTTALSLTPRVQQDKTIHIELRLTFTEISHPIKPVTHPTKPGSVSVPPAQPKPREFHPPVTMTLTAHPGDTIYIGTADTGKTTVRLLFATITILPPTKE
jgi:hypothetical protein